MQFFLQNFSGSNKNGRWTKGLWRSTIIKCFFDAQILNLLAKPCPMNIMTETLKNKQRFLATENLKNKQRFLELGNAVLNQSCFPASEAQGLLLHKT